MLRQLAITRSTAPALHKETIFTEVSENGSNTNFIDRRCLNQFLQANGVCFPAHLTEAFLRRFNFSNLGAVLDTITLDQFTKHVLFDPAPPIIKAS